MKMRIVLVTVLALTALLAVAVPAQAQATNTATWNAEYYNNLFLSGTPVFTNQVFNGLSLDFGANSPEASVNADNFSARYRTDAFFSQGTYRFSIRADDEFSFRVNDAVVLSTLDAAQPNTVLTVDQTLSGTVKLQLDYRERTGGASVSLTWQDVNASTTPVPTGTWLAEYFPNTTLTQPSVTPFNESSPAHNWGFNSPVSGIPADYWSARWRTSQNFAGGTYRFTTRADDGVRVYVDNVAVIDRFSESPGADNVAEYNISAGTHVITVEYLELYNNAFLDFKLEQVGASSGGGTSVPGGATVTVATGVLNVRNAPTAIGSLILTKIRLGETYGIVGRNEDSSWYRINVNGTEGWVSAPFVTVNNAGSVGVSEGTPTNIGAGDTVVSTPNVRLNLRIAPTAASASIGLIPANTAVKVIGRNADSSWFQVEYAGQNGWASAAFLRSATPINFGSIPVTG